MKCFKCGTPIEEDSIFCFRCGTKQVSDSSGSDWFSPANNLDGSPIVKRSHAQPAPGPVSNSFCKPVRGLNGTSMTKDHTPATPVTYEDSTGSNMESSNRSVEPPAKPIVKPVTHETPKNGSRSSKTWSKYVFAAVAVLVVIVVIFVAVGSNNQQPSYDNDFKKDGNYYTEEKARQIISEEGYRLGDAIETKSEDGEFFYKVDLAKEEYKFLTISGYVEFTAEYVDGAWNTRVDPYPSYEWKLSGSWFAETENYDVYMDIKSYTGSHLRIVLEAQFDSVEGGKGSCGEHDQMVGLGFADSEFSKEIGVYDVYLYTEVSGGYPIFQVYIDKDTMKIYQLYDSYEAEFVPN